MDSRVKNVALILVMTCALGFAGPGVAQTAKTAKSTAGAAKTSKRVAVSYKKDGAKSAVKAAGAAAAVVTTVDGNGAAGPDLKSSAALVLDAAEGTTLYSKNTAQISAIASITKLMTAMVVLDADLPMEESIRIEKADIDMLKHTGSRLRIGAAFSRRDLLHLALMSSENRAASALGRNYPGGAEAFVARMNARAAEIGMRNSRFVEPTGLSSENVSTADDLALLVRASLDYPLIREYSTRERATVTVFRRPMSFGNTNRLVRRSAWDIELSQTGYIAEAGQCLVMQARIRDRPIIIVLLDSWGKYTRIGDANRIKKWLESSSAWLAGHSS